MGLMSFHLKFKASRRLRYIGNKKGLQTGRKAPWMVPITHGYHVVENRSIEVESYELEPDSVVVQREQIEDSEVWFFGVFDGRVGDSITKYMQSQLFGRKLKQTTERYRSFPENGYLDADSTFRLDQCELNGGGIKMFPGPKLLRKLMLDCKALREKLP